MCPVHCNLLLTVVSLLSSSTLPSLPFNYTILRLAALVALAIFSDPVVFAHLHAAFVVVVRSEPRFPFRIQTCWCDTSAHDLALQSFWDPPVRHHPLNCSPRVRSGLYSSTYMPLSPSSRLRTLPLLHETVPLSQFLPLQLDVQLFPVVAYVQHFRLLCRLSFIPCLVNKTFHSSIFSYSSCAPPVCHSPPGPGTLHRGVSSWHPSPPEEIYSMYINVLRW